MSCTRIVLSLLLALATFVAVLNTALATPLDHNYVVSRIVDTLNARIDCVLQTEDRGNLQSGKVSLHKSQSCFSVGTAQDWSPLSLYDSPESAMRWFIAAASKAAQRSLPKSAYVAYLALPSTARQEILRSMAADLSLGVLAISAKYGYQKQFLRHASNAFLALESGLDSNADVEAQLVAREQERALKMLRTKPFENRMRGQVAILDEKRFPQQPGETEDARGDRLWREHTTEKRENLI